MDLLKQALKQKKEEYKSLKGILRTKNLNDSGDSSKKWIRQRDLEKARTKRYLEENERYLREKEMKKRKLMEEEENVSQSRRLKSKQKKLQEESNESENSSNTQPLISTADAIRLLREMQEPITLFGETDERRIERLRKLQLKRKEKHEGQRNEFAQHLKEEEEKLLKKKYEINQIDGEQKESKKPIEFGPLPKQEPNQSREEYTLFILNRLLSEWEYDLEQRPESIKRTGQGKMEAGFCKQTRKAFKPLYKALKTKTLAEDILVHLHAICVQLADREYRKADDTYLQLAIGNAPWPMGVTAVGIHERSAREKIGNDKIAHILNDERQRKYIQGVKRLMTYAEKKYPNENFVNIIQ